MPIRTLIERCYQDPRNRWDDAAVDEVLSLGDLAGLRDQPG